LTSRSKILCFKQLSAAGCFIGTYTTGAVRDFTAVWTYTFAVVDKVSAVYASRLIFFAHPLRLCQQYFSMNEEFKVSEKPKPNEVHAKLQLE